MIGVIQKRGGFSYDVDIKASSIAKLGVLEFEGATKRSKPRLEVLLIATKFRLDK